MAKNYDAIEWLKEEIHRDYNFSVILKTSKAERGKLFMDSLNNFKLNFIENIKPDEVDEYFEVLINEVIEDLKHFYPDGYNYNSNKEIHREIIRYNNEVISFLTDYKEYEYVYLKGRIEKIEKSKSPEKMQLISNGLEKSKIVYVSNIKQNNEKAITEPLFKEIKGFQSNLTDEQIKSLYEQMKGIYFDTTLDNWKAIFKPITIIENFEKVIWLKKKNRVKTPHITALREFFTLLNITPTQKIIDELICDEKGNAISLPKPKKNEFSSYYREMEKIINSIL